MTRVTEQKTRCRRIVRGLNGEHVVELRPEGLVMRPLRSRDPRVVVSVKWEVIYAIAFGIAKRRARS